MVTRSCSRARSRFAAVSLVCVLAGCGDVQPIADHHWPDAYWRSGPYTLIAIDTEAEMSLCFDSREHELVTLVGPTAYSVGADDRYVVVKQHPSPSGQKFNSAVTNYFVVLRAGEMNASRARPPRLIGPLTRAQFDDVARQWSLPSFSKTFEALE